ncbi:PTS sugar transporter subunit IIA [Enterococcus sp. LJL99]
MISQEFMYCNHSFHNQEALFNQLAQDLVKKEIVQDGFAQALKDREVEFPTGLPVKHGVAIPHTDGHLVNQDQLLFVTLENPIIFNEMGGDEDDKVAVKVVIMLAVKDGKKHLNVLQNLIEAIQKDGFVTALSASKNSAEMEAIIKNYL